MGDRDHRDIGAVALAAITSAAALLLGGSPVCAEPGLTGLVSNADGSFESGVRWFGEGIFGPEFGAFAEQMPVTGRVGGVEVTLGRSDHPGPTQFLLEVFVWADAEGQPGPVLALASLDFVGKLPALPSTTTLFVPIESSREVRPWVGARITPSFEGDEVAIAADLDGGAFVSPMTHVAPGLGLPEGWQPVGVIFEPARSLGIAATMHDIAFEGDILESAGGSDDGEPVVRMGVWDFERMTLDDIDAPGCAYDWPDAVGSIVDFEGWTATGPDPGAGVGPFFDENGVLAVGTDSDVEGQVLWFHHPDVLGFPPGHFTTYELPVLDDDLLGLSPGFSALHFVADSESGAPPETELLVWVVGSSVLRADGTWGPWLDLTFPVTLGPSDHLIPVLAQGSVRRIRIGMWNPSDILIQSRGKGADKVKEKKKTFGPQTGYKPVPVINQSGAKVTCQSAAAAQCLAYWAANGYPEILPAGNNLKKQQEELAKELAKEIEQSKPGENDGKKGKGWGGIGSYLKGKGLHSPQVPPGGPPPRRSLKSHDVPTGKGAPYDSIKTHLARSHDVILGFKAYRDSSGVEVEVRNSEGRPIAHAVTAAQVVEENGKKTIRVADPNGKSKPEIEDIEKAGGAYKEMEVAETGPPVKLKSKDIHWPGTEYFCLTSIQIVRPDPPNPGSSRPARVLVEELHTRSGGDSLVTYGYAIQNDKPSVMDYFVLQIFVPVTDVEAPVGWQWASLPSIPPDYETCENALGHNGDGIVWWTETSPVAPGESLSGFRFRAHESYPADPEALDWYVATENNGGEYGFVTGPAPVSDPTHTPGDLPLLDRTLRVVASPNPARSDVEIRFLAPVSGDATLSIFDAQGRLVQRNRLPRVEAGGATFHWDLEARGGRSLPSGIYLYRVDLAGRRGDGRIVLLE